MTREKKKTKEKKSLKRKVLLGLIIVGICIGVYFAGNYVVYSISEDPVFELPLNNAINKTTGIQTFHEEHDGTVHGGFDFELRNDTKIISPIDGVISDVKKFQMENDLWIITVWIDINAKWATFIAFEPCTKKEDIIDDQLEEIDVKVGDEVEVGDTIGILTPVNNSEFPHIHWNVVEKSIIPVGPGTDRSPYKYCSDDAKDDLDFLCDKYDKPPSYD